MSFLYGISGDVRGDINSWIPVTHANYKGESQMPGSLIERGRTYATNLINSKLRPRYEDIVPWVSGDVPAFIDELATCLAKGFVISQLNPGPEPKKNNKYVIDSIDCQKNLDLLASGEMELPEDTIIDGADEVGHTEYGITPVFDLDSEKDSRVDPNRLDQIDRGT